MSFPVNVARALEQLLVRATRLVRPRGDLTVIVLGDARSAQLAQPPRGVEVRQGPLAQGLAAARGRWVIVLEGDETLDPDYLRQMLKAATRRTAVVPVGPETFGADPTDRMTAAILTPGVAFPVGAARAAVVEPAQGGTIAAHRARALAALNRVPIPSPATPPQEPQRPSTATAAALLGAAASFVDIAPPGPRFAAALARARTELSRRGGLAIRDVPGGRADVMATLGTRLEAVDLSAFNGAVARDLAILYAAPPFLDTGGFVSARRLASRGEAYDAVVQDMGRHRPRDERSVALTARDLGRQMVARGPVSAGAWPGIEQYCRIGLADIDAAEREKGEYCSVYSRSMWVAPTVLAAWYKARHPTVPWTAEFSDPLSLRTNGLRRPDPLPDDPIIAEIAAAVRARGLPGPPTDLFFDAVEWMVYSLADRIVFTNENQRDLMLSAYPDSSIVADAAARSVIEPHPVPEEWLYRVGEPHPDVPADKITIGYFGNFYDVRGVGDLLDPLARLGEADRDRLLMLVFTPNVEAVRKQVADHPAADAVRILPALGYFDFLATARRLDWLVVADAHRPDNFPVSPYLPSKYADYRGSGTRIWGIVDENSVLSSRPLDARSPLGDVDAGAEVLRAIAAAVATA